MRHHFESYLSSRLTSDKALMRACYIVRFMLADREDLRRAQYYNKGIGRRTSIEWIHTRNHNRDSWTVEKAESD